MCYLHGELVLLGSGVSHAVGDKLLRRCGCAVSPLLGEW